MDFEQAVEDWKAHDQWEFADKQAAWGFFFMAGRESKQRENEMDPHIDGVVPVQMTDAERGFLNGMLIGNLRRIYAAHDDEGNDLSALPSRAADEIERLTDENERLREVLNAVLFAFDNDTATAAQLRKVYATEIAKAQALLTPNANVTGLAPGKDDK